MTIIPRRSTGQGATHHAPRTRRLGRTGRVAGFLLAAACALGVVAASPGAAGAVPIGGVNMAQNTTKIVKSTVVFPNSQIKSRAFVLADLDTGAVYAVRRGHTRSLPASTLKTLTALTILRNVSLTKRVTMTKSVPRPECACVGLQLGKTYTVDALLHALVMRSGNDAAELLATSTGSRARTLALMNTTARQLRALDTKAVTPSGLDGRGQSISAYDLALINRAAFADPRYRQIMATRTYRFGPYGGAKKTIVGQNEMYHMGYRGEIGSKNGWTTAARQTFVAAATRGGRTLLVTLLYNDTGIAQQAKALLDWGFALPAQPGTLGTLVASALPKPAIPVPAPKPTPTPTPKPTPTPTAPVRPVSADGAATPVSVQTSLSLGAVGFAGLALFPGRRPRPVGTRRRT
jgi:D-alanyl-D-alanine carboxypeptidase (penicillin-binding protein 5/6)